MATRNETLCAHFPNVSFVEISTEREENQLAEIATFLAEEARGSFHIERVFGFLDDYYDDKDMMTRYLFTHRPTAFAFKMKFY